MSLYKEPKFSKSKRLGKNKKKSWRGIDISSVEQRLEDERDEQRTIGSVIEKHDDELFVLYRKASDAILRRKESGITSLDGLKCYSSLVNTSKIKCPRKEYLVSTIIEQKALNKVARSVCAKNKFSLLKKKDLSTEDGNSIDIWSVGRCMHIDDDEFFLETTKRKRVQVPKHLKRKSSDLAPVEVAHPGASYYPSYQDHQNLLQITLNDEMKKERADRKLHNALDSKFPSEALSQDLWLSEMSTGLFDVKRSMRKTDTGQLSNNPPVHRDNKKTDKQRRKERLAALGRKAVDLRKWNRTRENKVYSMVKIKSELAGLRQRQREQAERRKQRAEAKKFLPKRLGKAKVSDPDKEVQLSCDLIGNLRNLKPEGNVLEDRYHSMLRRNIVEKRTKVKKIKMKKKTFEKKLSREVSV